MSGELSNDQKGLGRAFWCFTGGAALVVLSCTALVAIWGGKWFTGNQAAGQFGDQFGVANALFSGLAFAGVIATLLLQRKELILQRREMSRSTQAQANSSLALEKRLSFERRLAQSRQTLDMYNELMSERGGSFQKLFGEIARGKERISELPKVPARERLQQYAGLIQLVHFLDKCARLDRQGLIDLPLLDDLIQKDISRVVVDLLRMGWDGAEAGIAACIRELIETRDRMLQKGEDHWA